MKLYEISNEYQNVLNNVYDDETGEVNENALAILETLKAPIENKIIAVASYIKNIEAERIAIEDAKSKMAARENRLKKLVDNMERYLQENMERCGISEISSSPYFAIKIKKCPVSVDDYEPNDIPDKYKTTKEVVSINKIKIKTDLLAGISVPGACLQQRTRLEIK